jgi:hypothetical protein
MNTLLFAGRLPGACLMALLAAGVSGVADPPTIIKQPSDLSVSVGALASFSVNASDAQPMSYQWSLGTVALPNATNRTLNLSNVRLEDAGGYTVLVANASGSVTSRVALLDVDATFTKVSSSALNLAGGASGVAWGDFNGDGFPDLLIVGKGNGTTTLCANRGDGSFVKLPGTIGIGSAGLGGAAWADYDNDGQVDVFVGGANALYRNNGNAAFSKAPFNAAGLNSYCAAWADYDNDGFVDLFVGNYYTGGLNGLFHNNGDGTFTKITESFLAKDKGNSQGVSWCDYDNDGRPDLFVANTGGQKCFLYHNEGHGIFSKVTNSPMTSMTGNFACGAWGDYDNDGFPDLFVCGYNQKRQLFHNNGDGTFSLATNAGPITTESGDDQSASWADYDNDGYLDLFVASGGPTHGMKDSLYHNNGDGTFTKILRGSLVNDNGEGAGAAWGDFNRDGFPDLFVSNFQNLASGDKENYLYLNNANSNQWLSVQCAGRVSNRSAIGAKVCVKAIIHGREIWQLREISGGGNYVSQNSFEAGFGLGDATNANLVRVRWPSGIVSELTNVASKQFLRIVEPAKLEAVPPSTSRMFQFRVRGGVNVVYRMDASSDLVAWTPLRLFTNASPAFLASDPALILGSARFYRVVEPEDSHTP